MVLERIIFVARHRYRQRLYFRKLPSMLSAVADKYLMCVAETYRCEFGEILD